MLDFYKRAWQAFLAAFVGSMAVASYLIQNYRSGAIIMFTLALIFLVIFLAGLYHDYRDARKKAQQEKEEAIHKALVESFKRLGLTDEQAEIAAIGRTEPYLPVDGLDDNGWVTPKEGYDKSRRKK